MNFPPLRPPDVHALALWLGFAVVITVVTGFIWLRRVAMARAVAAWHTADGKILSVDIVQVPAAEEDHYEARMRYSYRVNGHGFEGSQLRVGPKRLVFPQHSKAVKALAAYQPGGRVTVYYDPRAPQQSVIEPAPTPNGLEGWAIMAGFMLVAGVYILVTLLFPSPF